MEKEEIIKELKETFEKTKKDLKFKSTLEEIDSICSIQDFVINQKNVSNQFPVLIINRLIDTYYSWIPILHSWIFPQAYDTIFSNESKNLTQEEKKEIYSVIGKIIYFARKSKRIIFEKNIKEQGKLIDELVEFEKKIFAPFIIKYNSKFEKLWKE